jgi:hypothetical protein
VTAPGSAGKPVSSPETVPGKGGKPPSVFAGSEVEGVAGVFFTPFPFFFAEATNFGSTRSPGGNCSRTESGTFLTVKFLEGGMVSSTNSKLEVYRLG